MATPLAHLLHLLQPGADHFRIQYWFVLIDFYTTVIDDWTWGAYGPFLGLAVVLFLAGGIVLPTPGADLGGALIDDFEATGKFSLLFVAAYLSSASARARQEIRTPTPVLVAGAAHCQRSVTMTPCSSPGDGNPAIAGTNRRAPRDCRH
jgi:hypothetical protein